MWHGAVWGTNMQQKLSVHAENVSQILPGMIIELLMDINISFSTNGDFETWSMIKKYHKYICTN